MNKSQNQDFFPTFFQPQNASESRFELFYRPKIQISLPFHILQMVKSLLVHIAEALKKVPFSGGASPYSPW